MTIDPSGTRTNISAGPNGLGVVPIELLGELNAHMLVQALHVAATLGIADRLADGPTLRTRVRDWGLFHRRSTHPGRPGGTSCTAFRPGNLRLSIALARAY
jgi:hypothetical protein